MSPPVPARDHPASPLAAESGLLHRYPATIAVAALTVAVGVPALVSPRLVRVLEQVPRSLRHGQWWRLVSPMLVQGYGVAQLVFNLLGIVVVGAAVGRRYGWWRWLVVYVTAGVAGIVLTSLWFPHQTDSGASAGVAGLIGAVVVAMLVDRATPGWPALGYGLFFAGYLGAAGLGAPVPAAVLVAAALLLVVVALRVFATGQALRRATAALVLVAMAAMLAVGDIHGVGLAVGVVVGAALLPPRRADHCSV